MPEDNLPAQICAANPQPLGPRLIDSWMAGIRMPQARDKFLCCLAHFAGWLSTRYQSAVLFDREHAATLLVSMPPGQANELVLHYTAEQLDAGAADNTVACRVSALRSLVKAARRIGLVTWALDVPAPHVESYSNVDAITLKEWQQLLAYAESQAEKSAKGKRDLCVLRLLRDHGLRRGEVVGMQLTDYEPRAPKPRVWILGKGKRKREAITLNTPTVAALREWLDCRGLEPGPLWTTCSPREKHRGHGVLRGLSGDDIHDLVAAMGRRAGLSRPIHPHMLRHTYVTRGLELTNGNIADVQRGARHGKPETTMRYASRQRDVAGELAERLGQD